MKKTSTLGMTLVEAMVAAGVLAVGTAALMNLVASISVANRQASFHSSALALAAEFSAQVTDATCDRLPGGALASDAGLAVGVNTLQFAPGGTGSLTAIGQLMDVQPPVMAQYQITAATLGDNLTPDTFEIEYQICDFNREPSCALGAVFPGGVGTKTFRINKVCNIRTVTDGRGEYFY